MKIINIINFLKDNDKIRIILFKRILLFYISILFISLLTSCDFSKDQEIIPKKQLLIYCGITMIKPIREIANTIEKENNCKIIITKGGTGNLLNSIKINKNGDIFLAGSRYYIEKAIKNGMILKENTVHAGYNRAAIHVKKGNPLKISSDVNDLLNKKCRIIIGAPNSSSIGKESEKILKKFKIEYEIYRKAIYLTTDSKELLNAIIKNKADVVINWEAIGYWDTNKHLITVIELDSTITKPLELMAGELVYSKHPLIAKKIIELIGSPKGQAIFKKFNF